VNELDYITFSIPENSKRATSNLIFAFSDLENGYLDFYVSIILKTIKEIPIATHKLNF
jgi:hypothetical protein